MKDIVWMAVFAIAFLIAAIACAFVPQQTVLAHVFAISGLTCAVLSLRN